MQGARVESLSYSTAASTPPAHSCFALFCDLAFSLCALCVYALRFGRRPSAKHRKRRKLSTQHSGRVAIPQPSLHHRRVHAPEIRGVSKIVQRVELRQARKLAVVTAFHVLAHEEHVVGRAV